MPPTPGGSLGASWRGLGGWGTRRSFGGPMAILDDLWRTARWAYLGGSLGGRSPMPYGTEWEILWRAPWPFWMIFGGHHAGNTLGDHLGGDPLWDRVGDSLEGPMGDTCGGLFRAISCGIRWGTSGRSFGTSRPYCVFSALFFSAAFGEIPYEIEIRIDRSDW